MPRSEFSKPTKRSALLRSGGLCEATGTVYGLDAGQRCNAPLSNGVEFDHYPIAATERDSDGLDNCVACCRTCHSFKTRNFDIPAQAKSKRVRDAHTGVSRPKATMKSAGFSRGKPQRRASTPPAGKFPGDIMGVRADFNSTIFAEEDMTKEASR